METFTQFLKEALYPWFLSSGIYIIIILVTAYIIGRFAHLVIERFVKKTVKPSEVDPHAEQKREATLTDILSGTARVVVWVLALMMIIAEFGVDIGPLIAAAGLVSVAVGFGAQYLVRDIITGLFIIIENQYRVGDVVCFNGHCGKVEHISLRTTTFRDVDGDVHTIPHGEITMTTNKTNQVSNINMSIGVDYSSDIDQVEEIINRIGKEIASDSNWASSIIQAPGFLRIKSFDDSAISILIRGTVVADDQWAIEGEINRRLKKTFDKEGINMPFPHRVLINKS